ncbi:MAG TPA: class I SAM-dependent methyltransferase [Candidatus Acidoferrales bacterium]|nr:class I SAM-dependent methyltransferase [Candidatus Acidoferrales bacterium]
MDFPSMAIVDQFEYWNNDGGARWTKFAERTTTLFIPLTDALLRSANPQPGEHVLDVGCGTARTTVELAKAVGSGRVVGLDISRVILDAARANVERSGAKNIDLILSDAATQAFTERFDLLFSQFGVMFFDDPVAAFRNLRRALKPSGRVAFACWRSMEENPWFSIPLAEAKRFAPPLPPVPPETPGPMAFADGKRVERILTEAGFSDITVVPHDEQLMIGSLAQLDDAKFMLSRIGPAGRLLDSVDENSRRAAEDAIGIALQKRASADGMRLGSGIWLVSGRNC